MAAPDTVFCPDCGARHSATARFCQQCGRPLDDVSAVKDDMDPVTVGDQKDGSGRLLDASGETIGGDMHDDDHDERVLWSGRPSRLLSPRMSLTERYKLTDQRLIITRGFIGRKTEEIDLYRVNDVSVKQHPLERLTRIGDVNIISADSSAPHMVLHNIDTPDRIKDMIREAARYERRRRRVLLREEF